MSVIENDIKTARKVDVGIKMARKERRDKGGTLFTDRDDAVLRWVGEQYGIRIDQLRRLLGRSPERATKESGLVGLTTAAGVVGRWKNLGLVQEQKFRFHEPAWIWLTRAGLKHLGLDYAYKELNLVTLEHLYQVNQVRLATEARATQLGDTRIWISERRIRRDTPRPMGKDIRPLHFPDAIVETEQGRVAVEVELTLKKPRDLEAIILMLVDEYPGVWYFYNERTKNGLKHAYAKLPETMRSKIRLLDLKEWT
jgi:hypothetical protein